MVKKRFVICCSKLWNPAITQNLSEVTGFEFLLIQKKEELNFKLLQEYEPEQIFFPHWSHIIPSEIHSNFKCIIFHMTDLPYGRGGSPLQNLIIRGHKKTKMSALLCSASLDEGDILLKKDLDLSGAAEEVFRRATHLIQNMILEILSTNPTPRPQNGVVTFFKRRTPQDSNLADCKTAQETFDMIRMLDSDLYPRAFLFYGEGLKVEFSQAEFDGAEVTAKARIKNEI